MQIWFQILVLALCDAEALLTIPKFHVPYLEIEHDEFLNHMITMKNKLNFYHCLVFNKCSKINKVAIIHNYY